VRVPACAFSLHLIWHSHWHNLVVVIWLLSQEYPAYYNDFSPCEYQCFIYYGFSRRSTSLMTSRCTSSSLCFDYASLVRVPAFDLPLCEFQSFDITSRLASSGPLIWPLALQVPVFQSDLSLCEFQSFNMTSRYASSGLLLYLSRRSIQSDSARRLYYWYCPLSQEYSPAGVSPKTLLSGLFRRSYASDPAVWRSSWRRNLALLIILASRQANQPRRSVDFLITYIPLVLALVNL
jgi:hypothetical protein